MITIDVRHLALSLTADKNHPYELLVTIAERMVEAAVDVVNSPSSMDDVLDPLIGIYEEQYGIQLPDLIMEDKIKDIRNAMDNHGWDRRLKIKVAFKRVGKALNLALIRMDLDATFVEHERLTRRPAPRKRVTGAVIRDNPSSDEINEFLNVVDREVTQQSHLRAVKSPKRTLRAL